MGLNDVSPHSMATRDLVSPLRCKLTPHNLLIYLTPEGHNTRRVPAVLRRCETWSLFPRRFL